MNILSFCLTNCISINRNFLSHITYQIPHAFFIRTFFHKKFFIRIFYKKTNILSFCLTNCISICDYDYDYVYDGSTDSTSDWFIQIILSETYWMTYAIGLRSQKYHPVSQDLCTTHSPYLPYPTDMQRGLGLSILVYYCVTVKTFD